MPGERSFHLERKLGGRQRRKEKAHRYEKKSDAGSRTRINTLSQKEGRNFTLRKVGRSSASREGGGKETHPAWEKNAIQLKKEGNSAP